MNETPSSFGPASKWLITAAVSALLLFHLVLLLVSSRGKSATVDEFVHVPSGCYYWKTGDFTLSGLNPPLLKLWSTLPVLGMNPKLPIAGEPADRSLDFPWVFGTVFMHRNWDRYDGMLRMARLPVMALSVLCGLVLFLWARRTFGTAPAMLALGLFAIEPNVLAHGRLATQDTGMMLAFLLTLTFLDGVIVRGGWWRAVLLGVFVGLACLVKYSGLVVALGAVAGVLVAVLLLRDFRFRLAVPGEKRFREGPRRRIYRAGVVLLVIGVVALMVVNLQYGFAGTFRLLQPDRMKSAAMKRLANSWAGYVPVPLPRDYVSGLDGQQFSVEHGETVNYLNGHWSAHGWWYYYLEAFLLKVPIPVLLLIGLGVASLFLVREGRWPGAWPVAAACAVFWAMHSFGSNKNIGLRYMLPLFPVALMLAGRSVLLLKLDRPRLKSAAAAALVFLAGWGLIETTRIHPHYLAYFNQLAGGPRGGARYLLDSNIDWGQDLKGLAEYLRKEGVKGPVYMGYFGHVAPELYGIQSRQVTRGVGGTVAVSLNYLCGMRYQYPAGHFKWLQKRKPVAIIGHTIYVYRTDRP